MLESANIARNINCKNDLIRSNKTQILQTSYSRALKSTFIV